MDVEDGGCGCWERGFTREEWVYKGPGKGSYSRVGSLQLVGQGKGDFEKERYQVSTGTRCRCACVALFLLAIVALAAMAWLELGTLRGADPGAADPCDLEALSSEMQVQCCSEGHLRFCTQPAPVPEQIIIHDKYFTHVKTVPVPRTVPVPIPPPARQVIEHKVYVHSSAFDCSGDMDWKQQWSPQQQRYCCYKRNIGCRTRLRIRPHYHTITHVQQVTVPVPVPVPAPPPRVVSRVVNVPIRDPPEIIKVPVRGPPHVVHKYIHQKQYVPVPKASPPNYHKVVVEGVPVVVHGAIEGQTMAK